VILCGRAARDRRCDFFVAPGNTTRSRIATPTHGCAIADQPPSFSSLASALRHAPAGYLTANSANLSTQLEVRMEQYRLAASNEPPPSATDGVHQDLTVVNHWLCLTRLRSSFAFSLFVLALPVLQVHAVATWPVIAVCAIFSLFSLVGLVWEPLIRRPRLFFHLQNLVDLLFVTVAIAVAQAGAVAPLLRAVYLLVIIPASLVSVFSGLVVATLSSCCHLFLLAWSEPHLTLSTFLSLQALVPIFLFFVVSNQAFFYSRHLESKNTALSQLADRLDESRSRLAALVDVARTLNSTLDPTTLLARVNRAALQHLRADWGATFLVDHERSTLRVAALSNVEIKGTELDRVEFPAHSWPVVQRIAVERIITLSGEEAAMTSPLFTGGRSFATVFLAGLYRDREMLGFLALGYATAPQHEVVIQQLAAIVDHAAIALRNAQLLDDARQASALKSEFLSTVSHELRTPINVITGFTEMLRDGAAGPLTAQQDDLLTRIDARGRELFDLIEATLHVGRIETGRDAVSLAPIPLTELVQSLQACTAVLARPPGVAFRWEIPALLEGVLITDAAKVPLIVRNLVSNAFKFTTAGSVTVRLLRATDCITIEVSDTGVGIAPDQVPLVFEMFRQLNNSPTPQHGGVGLGLYIVSRVVERLGGTIDVESTLGRGSTFRVVLPGFHPGDGSVDASEPYLPPGNSVAA
jgi:signal transduction histidine kinase